MADEVTGLVHLPQERLFLVLHQEWQDYLASSCSGRGTSWIGNQLLATYATAALACRCFCCLTTFSKILLYSAGFLSVVVELLTWGSQIVQEGAAQMSGVSVAPSDEHV